VGDSLLGQLESNGPTHPRSEIAFTRSLQDQGWRASVRHENAWRTAQVRTIALAARDRGAQVVIISAGSGDVRWVRESADRVAARQVVRGSIRRLAGELAVRCVVWPTLRVAGGPGDRATVRVVNEELRAAASAGRLRSPDWATLGGRHPEWFKGDGVHLTLAGEAAFQRQLLAAAGRCPIPNR
jgi:hypothetical protein